METPVKCPQCSHAFAVPEERTILDPEFLAKVNDSRYSSEWVGIALRWRLNSPHPSPHAAEPMVPNGQCSEIQLGGSAVSPQKE